MDADSLHASCRRALNLPSGLMIQYAASRSDSSIRTGSRTNFVWRSAHWIAYRRFHLRCRSLAELHCCNRSGLQKRLQGSITLPCASDNSIRDAATKPTRGTTAPIPPAEHGTGAYRRCSACGRGRPRTAMSSASAMACKTCLCGQSVPSKSRGASAATL